MGTALVAGAIRAGVVPAENVAGCDPSEEARHAFGAATGARADASPDVVAANSEVILLCTKPGQVNGAIAAVATAAGRKPRLVISVAAGVTLATLEAAAPAHFRVIRAMPNTPALVGRGASAFAAGSRATPEDAAVTRKLLGSVGLAIEVPERLMDAVTGLSGSGPAYAYLMIEAMADAGVNMGMPRPDALRLAAQTLLGAAAMVLETGEHPAVLKDMVTSPGGTTIAGLAELERLGLRAALGAAVAAATRRSASACAPPWVPQSPPPPAAPRNWAGPNRTARHHPQPDRRDAASSRRPYRSTPRPWPVNDAWVALRCCGANGRPRLLWGDFGNKCGVPPSHQRLRFSSE